MGTPPTAERIIELLGMRELPGEGGYVAETLRAEPLPDHALPPGVSGPHASKTAIYYLMTPAQFSAMHRLPIAELFHFYLGDPAEQLLLVPDGTGEIVRIGTDLEAGERPQSLVPAGVWQGARPVPGGRFGFSLLGTTMAPGFEFADFELGDRDELSDAYPAHRELVRALTRVAGERG